MTKATSVFLDGLRTLAALTVFVSHGLMILYASAFPVPDHAAVIVFFVLSGYVIANSTLRQRTRSAKPYALARLSRLYSVVIPALVLTALTVLAGTALHLPAYNEIVRDHDAVRFACTALFLQSVWWHNLCPPANGPFWSLGYEFWYYTIFGCLVFIRSWPWKIVMVLVCCLVVGENVLLLFPVWLGGWGLYTYRNRFPMSGRAALAGLIMATVATVFLMGYLPEYPAVAGFPPLFYSGPYLTDWVLGLGIVAVILFFERAWGTAQVHPIVERIIRWPAQRSFSLYLFHMPLLIFFQALGIFNPYLWWSAFLEIGLVLGVITILAQYTEAKRKPCQKVFTQLWDQIEARIQA